MRAYQDNIFLVLSSKLYVNDGMKGSCEQGTEKTSNHTCHLEWTKESFGFV